MYSSVMKDSYLLQVGDARIVGYFQGCTIDNIIYAAVSYMHSSFNVDSV